MLAGNGIRTLMPLQYRQCLKQHRVLTLGQLRDLFPNGGNPADRARLWPPFSPQLGRLGQLIDDQGEQLLNTCHGVRHLLAGHIAAIVEPLDVDGVPGRARPWRRPVRLHPHALLIEDVQHSVDRPVGQLCQQGKDSLIAIGRHFTAQGQVVDDARDQPIHPQAPHTVGQGARNALAVPGTFELLACGRRDAQHQIDSVEVKPRVVKRQHPLHQAGVTQLVNVVQGQPPDLPGQIKFHHGPIRMRLRGVDDVVLALDVEDDFNGPVHFAVINFGIQPVIDLIDALNIGRQAVQRAGVHRGIRVQVRVPEISFAVGIYHFSRPAQLVPECIHARALDLTADPDEPSAEQHVGRIGQGPGKFVGNALACLQKTLDHAIAQRPEHSGLHYPVQPRDTPRHRRGEQAQDFLPDGQHRLFQGLPIGIRAGGGQEA